MTEIVNYYVIQTEENKEYCVSNKLRGIFGLDVKDVIIPTEETIINIRGRRFYHSTRTMPEYVIIGLVEFTKEMVDRINLIKEVVQVITETTKKGPIPAKLEFSEVKSILKNVSKRTTYDGKVNILRGQYAGYSGSIVALIDDDVKIVIDIKNNPSVTIPIWYIGKEVLADKLEEVE